LTEKKEVKTKRNMKIRE